MQSQNRVLDDLARVATSALGVATGVRQEVEARLREQFERVLLRMDLVSREEFEVVQAMARKAREEQAVLEERLARLEALLESGSRTGSQAAASARKAEAEPAKKPGTRSKSQPASGGGEAQGKNPSGPSGENV